MSEESAVPSLKLPKVPAQKPKKYIHIQGFAERDKNNNFLFSLSGNKESVYKLSQKEVVSEEVFQTLIGDKTVYFANVFIPYSEQVITTLKELSKRSVEYIVEPGPNKVPGGKPPGGNPGGPILPDFRLESYVDGLLVEFKLFKS